MLSVLFQEEGGFAGFGAPQGAYPVGADPRAIAIGNLNGQGGLDLVVANAASDTVSLLYGVGDGTFGEATNVNVGDSPQDVEIADVNADFRADIVVANGGSDNVSVHTRAETFSGPYRSSIVAVGDEPRSLKVADLNNDRRRDIVTGNYASGNVSVSLGGDSGSFGPAASYPAGRTETNSQGQILRPAPVSIDVGDPMGDGDARHRRRQLGDRRGRDAHR